MTSSHYFDTEPTAPSEPRSLLLSLPDLNLRLTTDRGMFSPSQVDAGTRYLLLDGPPLPAEARELADVGAGYGPIACTLATRAPQARVWAAEINQRARELCEANAIAAGLTGVTMTEAPPADVALDALWSNPPIRIGKAAMRTLLRTWIERLRPGGTATLVVAKHKGADSLQDWLTEQGWPTERLSSRQGYRLLHATIPTTAP